MKITYYTIADNRVGYTAGRAVFSDAITLVRSDRFYTIDYTPATLTNWGMQEVQQDYNV